MNKRLAAVMFLWMWCCLSGPVSSDSTDDSAKTEKKINTKQAAEAAAIVIGGKKAAAVKAVDAVSGGQVTEGAKKGAEAATETVKEGVNKVSGGGAGAAESSN